MSINLFKYSILYIICNLFPFLDKKVEIIRKTYTANFKIQVIEFAKINENRLASRHFSVNEKQVRNWKKDKDAF